MIVWSYWKGDCCDRCGKRRAKADASYAAVSYTNKDIDKNRLDRTAGNRKFHVVLIKIDEILRGNHSGRFSAGILAIYVYCGWVASVKVPRFQFKVKYHLTEPSDNGYEVGQGFAGLGAS